MRKYVHADLAAGRWARMDIIEQMANVGSEVERALNWRERGNPEYSRMAFERALELLDLTLECTRGYPRLKEVARARETLVDFFHGDNTYRSTPESWRSYFGAFARAYAIRRGR